MYLDSEDFLVSNLLLPTRFADLSVVLCDEMRAGALIIISRNANTGSGLKMSRKLKPYFQFVLPVLILIILIQGLL